MWNDDDRKWLYEQMKKYGVNTGSYDDFTKSLDNKEDRDWYYQKSRSLGLNVGSADDFASMMVQPAQKPAAAPAPAKPIQTQVQTQVHPTVKTDVQPKQEERPQQGWQPTWQEKMGMQMQLDETMRQVKQSQQDFNTRMQNIRKGNTLGKTSEVKFNPESGRMERRYYTTTGEEVGSLWEQSRINLAERDRWESTTEEGRRHREKRIQNDFERRVGASLDKYDPDNAAAMAWQQAEERTKADREKHNDEIWSNYAAMGGGREMRMMETGDTWHSNMVDHLNYHDLQRMADDAWNMLGKEKQQSIIEDMYGALKNRYPQATEEQLQQAATEMAREQSDRRMFEFAVEKNAPKSATEYFFRKAIGMNSLLNIHQALARSAAGTTGDWEAREDAEQRFDKQGHKVARIAGTVTGFALDPLTWLSAGAGGGAAKGTTWLGGKMIGEAAMRKFGTTLGGRMLGGAIGGAVNFGTYEAGSEALDQMKWGGYIDEETGERKDGFSFGNVAGRAGHGLMMGAVTGVIAPYLGNVSDKLVRATESTIGKMGIRAGELGVGTVAEGTIFAVPEIIDTYGQYGDLINSLSDESSPNYIADEQERAAKIDELRNSRGDALMDVWTDNMAMIAGFKAQHLLKSAPRVIYDLARSKNGKAGFETRLRSILDGRGDLALTEDEKKELERRGYADLKDLTEEYSRYAEAKEEYDKARPTTTDASRMIEGGDGQAELPYNRFVELMTDNSVSEAARAKMYYYLTGHGLPMSTVMGSSILEDKDADGNVTGYTVQSFGANGVITSRSFGDKKRADVEANRINRQAELNGFDVGERYYDWQGDNKRMYEACESVAEETGAPANLLFDLMKRKTEAMNEVELEWAEKILNAYNGLGDKYGSSEVRAAINEEFGVDVDKAIRKEPGRRSEQEQKAVDEYANRLFADVRRKQEEAAERGEAPSSPDAPTSNSQIAALLGIDDGEQGDPVSAAFNRGHEADAQERQDISIELADPNNAEAQEAWNGVVQRINEDAAYMVAQQREQTKKMQHTDGSLRPAILKEKDSDGNDQQVYIVDGNVQMMPDGSVVDKASSDNIVVIYNPATGERKQIDPSADTGISSLGVVTTAEQREADIERSRQEYVQSQIDQAQGTVRLAPGQQIVLPTGEEAVVVATDADGGNITVALGDGTQATVQRSELQRIRDEKGLADYRKRHGITEEPAAQQPEASMPAQLQADGRVAGAPADYTADMELNIRDEDGIEKPAMVMGRVRYENGSFVPDANGNIIEYFMDGEVKHDHEEKLVDKVVSHVAPAKPEADTAPTATEPQPQQDDEERVIREGIAGVGEGLRDAVNEQAARVRENDINNWLQKPTVADAMRKYGEGAQSVEEVVQRALADNPNDETKAALGDIMRFDSSKQLVQGYISQPQPAKPAEAHVQTTEQQKEEPMPVGEDGEEDWHATTPERAHTYIFNEAGLTRSEGNEFIAAQIQAAQTALRKASSANLPKIGTSINKYNEAKAKRQGKIDEAQRVLDYWNGVREIQNAIQREENERRAADDAVRHDEAVAAAQAEYEARKQAEEERKAVGNENPMPAITEKWNNATKVDGHSDEIMLPDGTPLKGHYVLHESGASSPSHNPETWQKTDGFPMDSNDNSVNDRDYERDHDAQEHTQSIARQYDQRALQSVPVVSNDGVVLSGNGRTMAGQLAARDNTDSAYVNYLKEYAPKFGFTPEQVEAMQHPRVSFVPDEAMPYTAETFAKFNQQDMKSQNKTEQAVKLGKTVGDDVFKGIVRTINGYDTLGDFYNDADASLGAVYDLHNAGVVPQAQLAEMVDGIRGQEKLSAVGREFMENMLIGKAFEGDPDVVRMLTSEPSMRQSVITALGEIADNIAIGGGWSLQQELADAVKLCFDARKEGAKQGDIVSIYARQGVLFADPDQLQTVADFNNATMLMLADVLNDKRVTLLKITLQLYNNDARESAAGKTDMFAGGIRSREAILRDVINFIRKNYGKGKEIEAARAAAVERRKAESVQQNGTPPAGSGGSENTGGSGRGTEETPTLTHDEAISIIAQMEERANVAPEVELTIENWDAQFGEDGRVVTPIGEVKMGENQFTKLMRQGREGKLGMVKPTLETPDVIIEDASEAKDGDVAERKSSYVFVKAFKRSDGSRYYYFTSVTVSKDGKEVVISNQEKRKNAIANLLTNGKLVWKHADDVSAASDVKQGLYSSQGNMSDPTTEGTDAPQTNVLSAGKGKVNSSTSQAKGEKVSENQSTSGVQGAVYAAERRLNTESTEAQKGEAGKDANEPTVLRLNGEEHSVSDIENTVMEHVQRIIDEGGFDAEIVGVKVIGSYMRGEQTSWSDLDVLVEYSGKAKEYALFDAIAEEGLEINGVNVDINPITKGKSGTIEEFIKRNAGFRKIAKAEGEVNTEPTEAQKKAGNYKKGHVKIDGFDVTIENPRGSVRSGKDADGKEWEQTMHNTYGYIRGTEGVDGDHIDVFFSEDPSHGDVFVVDQVNKDGNFDEHKVMYGFPDIESARKAYLANYEDGWTGLGAITPVSKEEFKKWVQSSRRKTKPFSEYSSVKPLGDTQLGEQPTAGSFGPIYTQFKGRAREAIAFLLEKKDGEAIAALHHKDIGDIDLVWGKEGTGKSDGYGLAKLAKYHPEVLDNLQELLDEMVVTNRSENRVQLESETHQASVRLTWDNEKKNWLLTAFEKKNSALDNTTDTGKTSERGKRNDTATPQSTVSEGKGKGNSSTSQAKGEKVAENQVASGVEGAMAIVVEDVMSFPKEIREEDTISKEQNSGKRGDRIKVKAGLSGNDLYIQYKSGRSSKDKRRWATIKIPNATNYSAGQIIYRLGYIGTFTDIERLSGDAVLELFNKNGLRLHKGGWKEVSPREDALRDALVDVLRGAGVDVVTDVEEGQRVLDEVNGETRLHAKKRALETVSVTSEEEHQPTVVSSADGAKVLRKLDEAKEKYENISSRINTFIGDIANALGAQRKGSKSEYATFETKNGRVVTIRLADHNATVSNFDRRGELDGISIVVSPKKSAGVTNDGEAHVVEYYYDAIKLRRADGKPLADIVRSIKQALYSGEFEDTTGLAERQEVNTDKVRFFRTPDGHAYGFTKNGKIYIDPRIATAETPIHEYSHLWAWAFRKANPKEWANIVELMKGTTLWEEVKQRYPELKTEDEIADEVLAHYSGRRGAERLRAERERIASGEGDVVEKAKAISALERVKDALKRFWKGVADWLGIHFTSAEEVADKVLADMLHGVNPVAEAGAQREGVRYEANSEEAEIVAKAKADGTYMKAPDGKPSRLSPRQWVQVRTRAFKEWFGDWEKRARIEKLRKSEPIVKKGDEYKGRYELNSRSAEDYVIKSLRGEYTNSDTGDVIKITRASRKVTHHDAENDVHLRSIAYIPDMIENAVFIEERPNENGAKFASYRYYVVGLKIGDVHYTAKLVVGRKNGESYYDHSLTEIEKNSLIDLTDGVKADVSANETAYFTGKDKRLLSILQTNSSKVVYENGEPRVVYHQTNSTIFVNRKTGENFDNLNWKEKDYWENEASEEEWNDTWEERDFYVFDNKTHGRRSVEMPAFFFSPVYDEYHEYGDRTVAAFLNIRNPIVNPDIPNRGVTDTAGEDAMNALIAQGYDGFIREYDGEVEEINAFFPNQIKCAEENVGTFDGSNPDIRYQFVGEKGASAMDKAEEASVRLDNLAVAREMEAAGKDAKAVKLATGWERGGDGKWRYEIEDGRFDRLGELHPERRRLSAAEQKELDDALSETDDAFEKGVLAYKEEITDDTDMADIYEAGGMERKKAERIRDLEDKQRRLKGEPKKLDDYLENDELFNAYPQLRDIVIDTSSEGDAVFGKMGSYVHASNTIRLNDTSLSTLTHEVQHAIQKIEGFARGGSVRDVRNRIRQRIAELDNVSEHAKEMLARQVEYRALASKLGRAYEMLMKNGEDWAVRAASDNYWEAMNTLDNDENSRLNNVYPKGKNASEIAKDGFNRDKAIEELNRLSDYYASQISAEDMKNIKDSEALSGKINGKSDEELYHALGGEVEARNVQSRLGMTAEERRASLASETEDVAREDQIFLNDLLGVSMSESASTDLEDVNRRFNDELGRLTDENKDKIVLSLGRPSDILLAAGVSEKPMKLYGNKVIKKMRKHGFALDELKDLPRAVADPIAVFDNIGREGNRSILTELRTEQGNFLVTVDLGKDADVDFNIVSSVFGKGSSNVIDWINKGLATYINKEKALAFLSHPSAPIAAAAANAELDSAAKVVKEFENPKVSDEDVSEDDAVYRIREDVQDSEQNDADMMRSVAEQMGEKLHTNIHIIEDVNEITHPNSAVQERRSRSKGWYDTKTGQVNIVLPNNRSVDDVKASVGHETIAHKGLRELIGEENYDAFLDEVYEHLRGDLKQQIDTQASRAFIDDATRNGERAKSYEQHRRTAVDELFGRLAAKPFEEFAEGERTLWQKIKEAVRKVLDEFLGTLKLPKWFELGDNELRYMLWRSKERLERGREHPIDLARDIVKREELGLTDEARYNMGDAPETFKARQRRAVENKGTVMPGLNGAQVKVVGNIPRHTYTGTIAEATQQAIDAAKAKYVPNGEPRTLHYNNFGAKFDYSISGNAIEIVLSAKHQGKSVNKGVHLALAEHLDRVIGESIEVEEHPDRLKTGDARDNGKINPDALMHRFYGVANIDGVDYRVMTLMKEENKAKRGNGIHSYEVQKIEVLDEETPNTSNGVGTLNSELEGYPLAKLIKDVGKTMETDKNLLDESKLADESTDLYREVGETDDIWSDGSLGLHERMTAAAARLSANHKDNKTLRNDAMRAIGSNLFDLRKAMSLQRTFDKITAKRVADLARVLMNSGHLSGLTQQEVKRLMAAIRDSVGRENIDESIQKIMDIMVDNQLKHAEATLHELESIKGSKVDARGVEVQGQLDPDGQTLIKAMKEAQKIVNPCGGKTHDEKGEPTAWGNALESAQMRISSKTMSLMESG